MINITKLRNIGISAHIDSGKTTLTERILFYTGKIHKMEEVRGKSGVGAEMDYLDQERERGITIQSAATYCDWNDHAINIIDTPGHCDFTIEVERALRVLDGAILVLCGVAGIQSQSITVDRQMRRYGAPCIAFVNKCDRTGADPLRVCQDLRNKLGHNAVMIQHPIGAEDKFEGIIDLITLKAYYFDGLHGENVKEIDVPEEPLSKAIDARSELVEAISNFNDDVLELYLNDEEVSDDIIYVALRSCVLNREITPVCLGSAYKNKGVQVLLDAVISYLPSPLDREHVALDQTNEELEVALKSDESLPLTMLAFKLEDGKYGQLTYCRIFQGQINKGQVVYNRNNGKKHKIGRLVRIHADKMHDIESARAGDIIALFGIECASGDTFTTSEVNYTMTSMFVPEAVITLAIEPRQNQDLERLSKALGRFGREDPTFRVSVDKESGQTIISGMGELQLEVYVERIRREYDVEVYVGQPQVAYREAITKRAEFDYLHKKQTGGNGQYGRVCGYIEPITDGTHYEFVDKIFGGAIPREYISSCDKGFKDAMDEGGIRGFQIVGVRVVLNDGAAHSVDSSEMAFRIAAHDAFRQAFMSAAPIVLEPIMKVVVETPDEFSGVVLGGLNRRRGVITNNIVENRFATIEANVPLKEMFGYIGDLRGSTHGKANFTMEFAKYSKAPEGVV